MLHAAPKSHGLVASFSCVICGVLVALSLVCVCVCPMAELLRADWNKAAALCVLRTLTCGVCMHAWSLTRVCVPPCPQAAKVNTPGQALLYFGCRKAEEDYLYQQDWQEFLEAGALSKLRVAFSRAQPHKVGGGVDCRVGLLRSLAGGGCLRLHTVYGNAHV